jgi:hypothetical protein
MVVQNDKELSEFGNPFSDDLDVVTRGPVRSMRLPSGWSWGDRRNSGSQLNSYQELYLRENPEVTIWFFYRGNRISEGATKAFQRILQAPDHLLTKTEIGSISEILKDQSDSKCFDLLIAKTADVSGCRILIIEGRYKETQLDRYHIYLDADSRDRGGVIQEIFYQAPKADYFRHLAEARAAFNSIQWS